MKRLTWLLVLALATGCSGTKGNKTKTSDDDDDHDHGPGPHKGLIVDFRSLKDSKGKNLHFEFVVDHPGKEVRVYILDSKAKDEYPIKADRMKLTIKKPKFDIDLKAEKTDAN